MMYSGTSPTNRWRVRWGGGRGEAILIEILVQTYRKMGGLNTMVLVEIQYVCINGHTISIPKNPYMHTNPSSGNPRSPKITGTKPDGSTRMSRIRKRPPKEPLTDRGTG